MCGAHVAVARPLETSILNTPRRTVLPTNVMCRSHPSFHVLTKASVTFGQVSTSHVRASENERFLFLVSSFMSIRIISSLPSDV